MKKCVFTLFELVNMDSRYADFIMEQKLRENGFNLNKEISRYDDLETGNIVFKQEDVI